MHYVGCIMCALAMITLMVWRHVDLIHVSTIFFKIS